MGADGTNPKRITFGDEATDTSLVFAVEIGEFQAIGTQGEIGMSQNDAPFADEPVGGQSQDFLGRDREFREQFLAHGIGAMSGRKNEIARSGKRPLEVGKGEFTERGIGWNRFPGIRIG